MEHWWYLCEHRRNWRTKTVAWDGRVPWWRTVSAHPVKIRPRGERHTDSHPTPVLPSGTRINTCHTDSEQTTVCLPLLIRGSEGVKQIMWDGRLPDVDADIQMRCLPNQRATKNRDNSGWWQEQHGTLRNKDGQIRWDGGDIYSDGWMRNFLRWTGSLQHPAQIKVPQMPQST